MMIYNMFIPSLKTYTIDWRKNFNTVLYGL